MMDLFIHWITQIIIFILLAAIIDLLIPSTAIKKYIKLVVGLILIIIFLRPVFFLFTIDVEQALDSSFSSLYEEQTNDFNIENSINLQKTEIQASKDAYVLEQMTNQLTNIAKERLLDEFGVNIYKIDFAFKEDDLSYENLEGVIVYLETEQAMEGVVSIVDEIKIDTNQKEHKEDYDRKQMDKQVKKLLEEIWELDKNMLSIEWGEADDKT